MKPREMNREFEMKQREMKKKKKNQENDQMKGELMKSSNQNQKKRINTWWSREQSIEGEIETETPWGWEGKIFFWEIQRS